MAHSIEAQTPFLDHKLTEHVCGLPPSLKIRWDPKEQRFIEKWILREAAKPFITKELYERKKHVSRILGSKDIYMLTYVVALLCSYYLPSWRTIA
jgi:asparagine synthetase B (glutamine-hydrolysing)